jgi:hypothetical protein
MVAAEAMAALVALVKVVSMEVMEVSQARPAGMAARVAMAEPVPTAEMEAMVGGAAMGDRLGAAESISNRKPKSPVEIFKDTQLPVMAGMVEPAETAG